MIDSNGTYVHEVYERLAVALAPFGNSIETDIEIMELGSTTSYRIEIELPGRRTIRLFSNPAIPPSRAVARPLMTNRATIAEAYDSHLTSGISQTIFHSDSSSIHPFFV